MAALARIAIVSLITSATEGPFFSFFSTGVLLKISDPSCTTGLFLFSDFFSFSIRIRKKKI